MRSLFSFPPAAGTCHVGPKLADEQAEPEKHGGGVLGSGGVCEHLSPHGQKSACQFPTGSCVKPPNVRSLRCMDLAVKGLKYFFAPS